jgi:hypothetical protein
MGLECMYVINIKLQIMTLASLLGPGSDHQFDYDAICTLTVPVFLISL